MAEVKGVIVDMENSVAGSAPVDIDEMRCVAVFCCTMWKISELQKSLPGRNLKPVAPALKFGFCFKIFSYAQLIRLQETMVSVIQFI